MLKKLTLLVMMIMVLILTLTTISSCTKQNPLPENEFMIDEDRVVVYSI